tara:strand:+ start:2539 stop:3576 length:1038 start_codon:yes stop_codon:yes gene_type:complete
MAYFNYFSNIEYKFPNGVTHEVKNIFTRPVFSSNVAENIELGNNQSPDNLALSLYDDPSLYYLNLLYNDIISDDYWPITGEEYTSEIESTYAGYSFHILETPETDPDVGDLIILKSDFDGFVPDENDLSAQTLSYGIVESWNPNYRKLWIKNYNFGSTGAQSEADLFKEDSRFYIFKRSADGQYPDDSQLRASNVSGDDNAFALDPNYAGNSGDEFTMKRVSKYLNSIDIFENPVQNIKINPFTKNMVFAGSQYTGVNQNDFAGVTYNSGNTNGTCSLLEGFILSANGQTGPDNGPYTTPTTTAFRVKTIQDTVLSQNEDEKNISVIPQSAVGDVIQAIASNFNG